jgi:hypothetical protein
MTNPVDETESVALAMVRAKWGNGAGVTAQDEREARVFIAAADALLKCRLAQHGPKGRPGECVVMPLGAPSGSDYSTLADDRMMRESLPTGGWPSRRLRWPADGTSEPALDRGNEDGA